MSWARSPDEPEPTWREAAPDMLSPIDPSASVSGHQRATETPPSHSEAPEHQWAAASEHIFPALRPAGTRGTVANDDAGIADRVTQ